MATAYFCAIRRPGKVLRVSNNWVCKPSSCLTYSAVLVATADKVCTKFRAGRSTVSKLRAEPANFKNASLGATRSPSFFNQVTCTDASYD